MKLHLAIFTALSLVCASHGQTLKLPATIDAKPNGVKVVTAETDCKSVVWYFPDNGIEPFNIDALFKGLSKNPGAIALQTGAKGAYRIVAIGANDQGKQTPPVVAWVVVGDAPIPPSPTPPTPPGPKPPEPPPTPDVVPIPGDGFRVLILYETGATLTPQQSSVLTAAEIRKYFADKCVKGPDGKTPEARIWDKDVDVSSVSEIWRQAVGRGLDKAKDPNGGSGRYPWIMISDGKKGFEGPLPLNVADTMKLLRQYGDK